MNRARLRELGFELGARAEAGVSDEGAWFATAPDGAPVVLKWFPDETVAERYAVLLPASTSSDRAASRCPSTHTSSPSTAGRCRRSRSCRVRRCATRHRRWWSRWSSASPPWPVSPVRCRRPDLRPWGASVVHTLTVGVDGWAMHEPLRTGGRRSAAVLDRMEAVGADADPAWFPTDGLVHLDLHTDNILAGDDGTLTGIIDWEGACAGDPRFDLVRFAYDLDGHDQPVWDVVEATGIEPRVLRAYVAHHALRCTSWQIHHHTDDVPRQLDRAERVLDRYEA